MYSDSEPQLLIEYLFINPLKKIKSFFKNVSKYFLTIKVLFIDPHKIFEQNLNSNVLSPSKLTLVSLELNLLLISIYYFFNDIPKSDEIIEDIVPYFFFTGFTIGICLLLIIIYIIDFFDGLIDNKALFYSIGLYIFNGFCFIIPIFSFMIELKRRVFFYLFFSVFFPTFIVFRIRKKIQLSFFHKLLFIFFNALLMFIIALIVGFASISIFL